MHLSTTAALVTGGASGLGEATARHFASEGAQVTILDRDVERGTQVAAEIGGHFAQTDVTDEDSVAAAVGHGMAKMGKITAVVNCAGIAYGIKTVGKEGPHPLDAFQRTIDINLVGTFNVSRLAAAEMSKNDPEPDGARGVIINTASIAAYDGQKGQAAYAASKGGVVGMTLPMARDLASTGIRVMTIAPGIFMTPMLAGLPEEVQQQLAADVPNPARLGDPKEYGRLAAFIVEMGYLNGEVIRIDGALRMR
ncbi:MULTISPECIES: 3-hydroxyacyl-CoA dehydrogenase [unclassified Ruegeria]|uniref:3-hydroxyacyl-CoA dehydrogenase n=1 Tax=unclassified Ruegeria TaxID=2625375 RepID=UPI001488D1E7|nr:MULTISPECIES: 3-hydroxyacyl-CoA dehydrogenase [unclassified Ruegeria]NOD34120.1 SDR family NAD(P)-dependent oxidoreductase [Ruegeria sp. HKCCD7296]NOD46520.1 SDR family NAD(P)-dependent oxidoreductase [Ruegeria sp. HKCCD5849]NOD50180.1 SDR family NAD(P)-dependent oxidoreductase [Ruegeria sp. HKCCD5851]NOD67015.1 SDR family NAD(P)-dependent oxidoreductase [Ruegeria sp. HKCCD7303]NOE41144.1 SDR family NAD(P)-dependent oxidoreductase [Ruegeria sp. HKCCD7319]